MVILIGTSSQCRNITYLSRKMLLVESPYLSHILLSKERIMLLQRMTEAVSVTYRPVTMAYLIRPWSRGNDLLLPRSDP